MSVSRLVTVWCNGCGDWDATGHNAADARREARRMGWAVSVPGTDVEPTDSTARSLWMPGQPRDFCPDCRHDRTTTPPPNLSTSEGDD